MGMSHIYTPFFFSGKRVHNCHGILKEANDPQIMLRTSKIFLALSFWLLVAQIILPLVLKFQQILMYGWISKHISSIKQPNTKSWKEPRIKTSQWWLEIVGDFWHFPEVKLVWRWCPQTWRVYLCMGADGLMGHDIKSQGKDWQD